MKKLAIVYWSGTGNTEAMVESIEEGFKEVSEDYDKFFSDDFNASMMDDYEVIAFGCPSMGDEELEEDSFAPMFEECKAKLDGKKICIFGSYEWNNGEWMEEWEKVVKDLGADLVFDPLPAYDYPDEDAKAKCKELGKACANA